ncbi:MAG: DUF2121 domain-containing protein [Methanosarcinales archaeon]|nr:DUF2121 domain-containing protein [Methanosarcinales archaeon]
MSLVIAYAGSKEALICGDQRSITFAGRSEALEEELYSGRIAGDGELERRARELDTWIRVTDQGEKVWRRGGLLVGEVKDISPASQKRRRVYLTPGAFLMADIVDGQARVTGRGGSSAVVLGNQFTRSLANSMLQSCRGDVEKTLRAIMDQAGQKTASVSRGYAILSTSVRQPDPEGALVRALEEDCQESGWQICAVQ